MAWFWHDPGDGEPRWDLPELPVTDAYVARQALDLCGHPQNVMENAVDYGHLPELHKAGLKVLEEPHISGTVYSVTHQIQQLYL
ncbi:hypothetical protein [Streptomyces sp. CA-132043]|uniref:hypothetical protein n=1 Tax=Streptomyces sp. CA-132043 TaxID=3240048 RepID=UPI003D92C478